MGIIKTELETVIFIIILVLAIVTVVLGIAAGWVWRRTVVETRVAMTKSKEKVTVWEIEMMNKLMHGETSSPGSPEFKAKLEQSPTLQKMLISKKFDLETGTAKIRRTETCKSQCSSKLGSETNIINNSRRSSAVRPADSCGTSKDASTDPSGTSTCNTHSVTGTAIRDGATMFDELLIGLNCVRKKSTEINETNAPEITENEALVNAAPKEGFSRPPTGSIDEVQPLHPASLTSLPSYGHLEGQLFPTSCTSFPSISPSGQPPLPSLTSHHFGGQPPLPSVTSHHSAGGRTKLRFGRSSSRCSIVSEGPGGRKGVSLERFPSFMSERSHGFASVVSESAVSEDEGWSIPKTKSITSIISKHSVSSFFSTTSSSQFPDGGSEEGIEVTTGEEAVLEATPTLNPSSLPPSSKSSPTSSEDPTRPILKSVLKRRDEAGGESPSKNSCDEQVADSPRSDAPQASSKQKPEDEGSGSFTGLPRVKSVRFETDDESGTEVVDIKTYTAGSAIELFGGVCNYASAMISKVMAQDPEQQGISPTTETQASQGDKSSKDVDIPNVSNGEDRCGGKSSSIVSNRRPRPASIDVDDIPTPSTISRSRSKSSTGSRSSRRSRRHKAEPLSLDSDSDGELDFNPPVSSSGTQATICTLSEDSDSSEFSWLSGETQLL